MIVFFYLFCLLAGIYFTQFGWKLLFKDGFVESLRKGKWKSDNSLLSEKGGLFYDKYTTGLRNLIAGILFFALGVWGLFHL
jgi:hypothetical protein